MIVFARQCIECGSSAEVDHHVIPRSRGGTATVPLCGPCHGRAHNTDRSMSTGALSAAVTARLKAEGKHVHTVPYGYRIGAGGRLEERMDHQRILQWIFSLKEDGLGGKRIAKTLNAASVPSPRGRAWGSESVRKLLRRFVRAPGECRLVLRGHATGASPQPVRASSRPGLPPEPNAREIAR